MQNLKKAKVHRTIGLTKYRKKKEAERREEQEAAARQRRLPGSKRIDRALEGCRDAA